MIPYTHENYAETYLYTKHAQWNDEVFCTWMGLTVYKIAEILTKRKNDILDISPTKILSQWLFANVKWQ